jgi:hypothetical protein
MYILNVYNYTVLHQLKDISSESSFNYSIHTVKKLKSKDLTKVIEWYRFIIINTNFLFYLSLHLFIGIYYNRSSSFNYFN